MKPVSNLFNTLFSVTLFQVINFLEIYHSTYFENLEFLIISPSFQALAIRIL